MPHILVAGTVSSPPKSFPFPDRRLLRCTVELDVDGTKYLVVAHDLVMAELEAMVPGAPVSVQGDLVIERSQTGAITGLHVEAKQTLPLRRRSINRAPIAAMR